MSEYDKHSLRIYMLYHVSELRRLHSETVNRWYEGRDIYERQKQEL